MRKFSDLSGETLSGDAVSFSREAYLDAMNRYTIKDIEKVVLLVEAGKNVPLEVANFMRDFSIIQEAGHPDFDRGNAIGSLASRIEVALGQITPAEIAARDIDLDSGNVEYALLFGNR